MVHERARVCSPPVTNARAPSLQDSALCDQDRADLIVSNIDFERAAEDARYAPGFFGDVTRQPFGHMVPTGAPAAAAATPKSTTSTACVTPVDAEMDDASSVSSFTSSAMPALPQPGACTFGSALLEYLSSPPLWLYPAHILSQLCDADAAPFLTRCASHKDMDATARVYEHCKPIAPADVVRWVAPLCDARWQEAVCALAKCVGMQDSFPHATTACDAPISDFYSSAIARARTLVAASAHELAVGEMMCVVERPRALHMLRYDSGILAGCKTVAPVTT
ncbi:hypothetical protein EON67_10170, partial [archaeon]